MPKQIEERLRRDARKQGLQPGTDRYNAYVYGTSRRIEDYKRRKRQGGSHARK